MPASKPIPHAALAMPSATPTMSVAPAVGVTGAAAAPPPDGSVVKLLDTLLQRALALGASDLHFESDAAQFRVRLRVDGLLHVAATPPLALRDALLTRLKVLARMDIAEKRLPQDGRIAYRQQAQTVDLRVSSLPTLHGEKLVVRVLNGRPQAPDLASLGCAADELARLHQALDASDGLLMMTGPTGSGKSWSLYSCLAWLNRPELNLSTVEDPVEIQLPGINQVGLNERAGLGFANTLRALLRQDPDVIMVGEIRDLDTAEIAVQAAQTGHLVLSTLHTQDAPGTLARLQHMGVPAYHVAASVRLIVAQRLLRRLCPHCRCRLPAAQQSDWLAQLHEADRRLIDPWLTDAPTLYAPVGCADCQGGYTGRLAVFQMLPVSEAMQALLFAQADRTALAAQAAREAVRTLRQSAWLKALQGLTSPQEVLAHTPPG